MPRGIDGSYSLPNGSLVTVGETIAPSQHNPPLQDIAQAMTGSLSRDGQGGMRAAFNGGGFRATNLAAGVQPTDAVIMSQLTAGSGVPAGTVVDFAGATVPTGWLICAGQALSRVDFPDLFAALGTTYGAPSGATFNLPDTRGRVVAGRDVDSGGFAGRLTTPNSQTLGASGGTQTVTLTTGQMPTHTHEVTGSTNSAGAHTHSYSRPNNVSSVGGGGTPVYSAGDVVSNTGSGGDHSHTISVSAANAGSSEAHSNVQPVIVMTKIIKASNN